MTLDDLASRGMDLHAKMYHVWNGRNEQYLYLGSANATSSAFERNGEFLLRLKYKYGNTRSAQFLGDFYEKDNSDSKFMPLNDAHFNGIKTEKIERIVPMYPMSEDESQYDRLIKVLSLYRLTMGQPRQEELLQMPEGKISQDQIKQLLFDLSPFSRNKLKK